MDDISDMDDTDGSVKLECRDSFRRGDYSDNVLREATLSMSKHDHLTSENSTAMASNFFGSSENSVEIIEQYSYDEDTSCEYDTHGVYADISNDTNGNKFCSTFPMDDMVLI